MGEAMLKPDPGICDWKGCDEPLFRKDMEVLAGGICVHRHHLTEAKEEAPKLPPLPKPPLPKPRCPRFTDEQVRACTNPAVLDVLAGVEVLGGRLSTVYEERLREAPDTYDHWEYGARYDAKRLLMMTPFNASGTMIELERELNHVCPEQGLVWSPSRRFNDAEALLDTFEHRDLFRALIECRRVAGQRTYVVELRATYLRASIEQPTLEMAIAKAAILLARRLRGL